MALPHPSALSVFSFTTYPFQSKSRILQSKKMCSKTEGAERSGGEGERCTPDRCLQIKENKRKKRGKKVISFPSNNL